MLNPRRRTQAEWAVGRRGSRRTSSMPELGRKREVRRTAALHRPVSVLLGQPDKPGVHFGSLEHPISDRLRAVEEVWGTEALTAAMRSRPPGLRSSEAQMT